jgi:hypothetical protein
MTTGALIALEVFIGLVILFGIYAGRHPKDKIQPKSKKKKHNRL